MKLFKGKLVDVPKSWTLLYHHGRLVQIVIGKRIVQLPKKQRCPQPPHPRLISVSV